MNFLNNLYHLIDGDLIKIILDEPTKDNWDYIIEQGKIKNFQNNLLKSKKIQDQYVRVLEKWSIKTK